METAPLVWWHVRYGRLSQPVLQCGPIDQKTTAKIEGFRRILGDSIFGEILWRVAHAKRANAIPNAQLQTDVAEAMERATRGIHKAHSLAEEIGDPPRSRAV